jgi:predicted GH43/DUF377 family glycosyl hydrolase
VSLDEIYAIQKLKYSYGRFLDTKQFDKLASLMVEDVTVAYGGGAITLTGAKAVEEYLTKAMGSHTMLTSHMFSHPEITIDRDTAQAHWALQDVVIIEEFNLAIRGASIYDDQYVRVDGKWLIKHTGYKRLYEEIGPRAEGTRTTASWYGSNGRSSLV